jgi:micrococcal nuclease
MVARPGRGSALAASLSLAVLVVGHLDGTAATAGPAAVQRLRAGSGDGRRVLGLPAPRPAARPPRWLAPPPPDVPAVRPAAPPRGFLIYLIDGSDPIVVSRYTEESGQIVFEKYGGSVRIPTYEVLRIVPDTAHPADRTANLPPVPGRADTGGAPLQPESDLYVTMRGGNNLRVARLTPEGDLVRVAVPNGSFTVPRSEVVSVVRVPPGSEVPEVWLSVLVTDPEDRGAAGAAPLPVTPDPRVPYQSSDRPHYLRLANGQLMRVEGFWVEDGEFRFRRFGGIIGIAMNEVMRLFPEEIAPVRGRTPVRFVRRVEPDLLEVSVRSGQRQVRLVGVEPVSGTWTAESPWRQLEPGSIIYLEFDRQRYDADGNWLAYVFLPNGRMLNAELIRLGLARPVGDGRNARYLDLFHEMSVPPSFSAEGAEGPGESEAEP